VSATINVNMTPCTCEPRAAKWLRHASGCGAPEVLIPCPVPPSFACDVVLGACDCVKAYTRINAHKTGCAGMPIRVSCSIRSGPPGQEWAGSEVFDVDADFNHPINTARQMEIARERWALVVALVTGNDEAWRSDPRGEGWNLQPQRDIVFAALAAKALSERADDDTTKALAGAIPGLLTFGDITTPTASDYLSAIAMRRYVARLIDQVGTT
jgi:hypothetical protein